MAILAESLVDEWLNRKGFFTVRGIKDGVDEIDLLGVRPTQTGLEGWHVEVQASFRPVNYITKLTEELSHSLGKKRGAAIKRTDQMMRECVRDWVAFKYTRDAKVAARNRAWPGLQWQFYFVHGVAKHPEEVEAIKQHEIAVVPLHQVLSELCTGDSHGARGAAGTDFAEMMDYYERCRAGNLA